MASEKWKKIGDGCYEHGCGMTATWLSSKYSAVGKTGWHLLRFSDDLSSVTYRTLRDAKAAHKCKGGKHGA